MRKGALTITCLIPCLMISLLARDGLAQAPDISVSSSSLVSGLTDEEKQQVDRYIQYWAEKLREAEKPQEVLEARSKLLGGYARYPSEAYQVFYAERLYPGLGAMRRERPEGLRNLKEISMALIFAEIRRPRVQLALEILVRYPSDAVRYVGWQAYDRIREEVLAEPGEKADGMLATLADRADRESAPMVLEQLFRVLTPPEFTVRRIPEDRLTDIRRSLFESLQIAWSRACAAVADNSADTAKVAGQAGLSALTSAGRALKAEKNTAVRKTIVQMLVDMLWCSSKAYLSVEGKGPVADANAGLLANLEMSLRTLSGKDRNAVEKAMETEKPEERATTVRVAALDWIRALSDMGVEDPAKRFVEAEPTTTTAPATAPGGSGETAATP